jgi:hypothetical protein
VEKSGDAPTLGTLTLGAAGVTQMALLFSTPVKQWAVDPD